MNLWNHVGLLKPKDLEEYRPALHNLQANILSAFRRDAARYGVVRMKPNTVEAARAAFGSLARHLTRASDEIQFSSPNADPPASPALSIGFSSDGLEKMGDMGKPDPAFPSCRFSDFLQEISAEPAGWEAPFSLTEPIDAIILIAAPTPEGTVALEKTVTDSLRNCVSGQIEWLSAFVKRDPVTRRSIENFGFRDGISQPVFFSAELKPAPRAPGLRPAPVPENPPRADSTAPLSPRSVLVRDPGKSGEDNELGSYLAFVKIEQDIELFDAGAATLAKARYNTQSPTAEQMERGREWLIGRKRDGTLLLPANGDHNGQKATACPFAAHIHKMNPRTDLVPRIARRGLAYEEGGKKGIYFQCYQRDLDQQFEFLFRNWGNNSDAPTKNAGVDPLLGQPKPKALTGDQHWPEVADPLDIRSLVTIRGGEYFYMPSIAYFERMAPATTPAPPPPPVANPRVSS
jgi:Dyp-type peroxidase family